MFRNSMTKAKMIHDESATTVVEPFGCWFIKTNVLFFAGT